MIPEKVIICGHEIDIILENPDNLRVTKPQCWGTNDCRDLKIYLDKNLSKTILEQTLIHEILHYINYFTFEDYCSQRGDPKIVSLTNYENAFWNFIKDNTNFFCEYNK